MHIPEVGAPPYNLPLVFFLVVFEITFLQNLRKDGVDMYCEMNLRTPEKFWIIWRLRYNVHGATWLTKEDCPGHIHTTYTSALAEAERLCTKHREAFVVLEARDIAKPPFIPTAEVIALRDRR